MKVSQIFLKVVDVLVKYTKVIKEIYNKAKTWVKMKGRATFSKFDKA